MVSYTPRSVTDGRYRINTVATFQCDDGYYLSGTNSTTCESSGFLIANWSEQTPTCEGFYYSYINNIDYVYASNKENSCFDSLFNIIFF